VLSGPVVWWLERHKPKAAASALESELKAESTGDVR
jgi:hypothetical protein